MPEGWRTETEAPTSTKSPARWKPRPGKAPGWLPEELEDTFAKAHQIGFQKPGLTSPERSSGEQVWASGTAREDILPDNGSLAPQNCMGTPGSQLKHRESVGCRVGAACHVKAHLNKALMLGRQWDPETPGLYYHPAV